MSNFPAVIQTPLTQLMKIADDEGLCVPLSDVHASTRAAAAALKACDEAIWNAFEPFKRWQEHFAFAPAKLAPIAEQLGQALYALQQAHVEAMKIAIDKKIKLPDGGGK